MSHNDIDIKKDNEILILLWELEKNLTKYDEDNGYTSNSKIYYKNSQKKEVNIHATQ